ncbi:hypothetical protein HG536_0A09050 [Torulaspora globosa]|uniref:Postreplication repair E3 ubiquitin-protein ligase RAD18 n=1 Tax=Torulaspora globosa TaxID=48254 RepID=A0A7G3ZC52_9SACH|nr:uncharacterized protein HG536_0A09050 [Torulaspora globosa]QLL31088.1 hypothetical protein HG536_0A09050 [Torulaspora globosa]
MNQRLTDASDFAQSAVPQLTQLDKLLRCHICKEFLRVPVLTPCGHTFCSLCIRQYLRQDSKCPLCLNELRESSLRSEFLINEVIEVYKSLRPNLLNVLVTKSQTESPLIELGSHSDEDDDIKIVGAREKPSSSASSSLSLRVSKPPARAQSLLKNQAGKAKQKMAQCPICEQFYPIEALERTHLDECLTMQSLGSHPRPAEKENSHARKASPLPVPQKRAAPKPEPSQCHEESESNLHVDKYLNSAATVDRQRLPKVNFTSMSVSQIRQKLASLGLPVSGTRQNMIARYDHYEMLWNSNFCDAIEPVDETELKRQLLSWEASRNSSNAFGSVNSISFIMKRANGGKSYQKLLSDFKNDKFDRRSWISLFHQEFKELVREARRKLVNKRSAQALTANGEEAFQSSA